MNEIKCPYDLNQFLLGDPIFENPFPEEECKQRKFYGDCYHCFATAIASRDHQLNASVLDKIRAEIDEESAKSFGYPNWERAKALEWVLSIIDKYKAECEGK